MRSIGKKNKVMVEKITLKVITQVDGLDAITKEVISRVPEDVFATWEGAYSEIEGLIFNTAMNNRN